MISDDFSHAYNNDYKYIFTIGWRATCTTLDLTLSPFFLPTLDLDIDHSYTLGVGLSWAY
jgi:hypothetical protein